MPLPFPYSADLSEEADIFSPLRVLYQFSAEHSPLPLPPFQQMFQELFPYRRRLPPVQPVHQVHLRQPFCQVCSAQAVLFLPSLQYFESAAELHLSEYLSLNLYFPQSQAGQNPEQKVPRLPTPERQNQSCHLPALRPVHSLRNWQER